MTSREVTYSLHSRCADKSISKKTRYRLVKRHVYSSYVLRAGFFGGERDSPSKVQYRFGDGPGIGSPDKLEM